jgi:hypothetical protein
VKSGKSTTLGEEKMAATICLGVSDTEMYAKSVAANPIRAIIIYPDGSYEIRPIKQDIRTWQSLVRDDLERVHTDHGDIWFGEHWRLKDCPVNRTATYLWWKLAPEMEAVDVIGGPAIVTGLDDEAAFSEPVSDAVIDLLERIVAAINEDQDPSGEQAP